MAKVMVEVVHIHEGDDTAHCLPQLGFMQNIGHDTKHL